MSLLPTSIIRLLLIISGIHPNPGTEQPPPSGSTIADSVRARARVVECQVCQKDFKPSCIRRGEHDHDSVSAPLICDSCKSVHYTVGAKRPAGSQLNSGVRVSKDMLHREADDAPPSQAQSQKEKKQQLKRTEKLQRRQQEEEQRQLSIPEAQSYELTSEEMQQVSASVATSQACLHSNQSDFTPSLAQQLLDHVARHKKPIRTSFSDHDKCLVIGIMESLVTLICCTRDDAEQQRLLLCIFTVFPAIYCQRLRGGATDRRSYTTFLRKRKADHNYTDHVKKLIYGNCCENDPEGPAPDNRDVKQRLESLARRGKTTQALGALEESKLAPLNKTTLAQLRSLHPDPARPDYSTLFPSGEAGGSGDASYFEGKHLVEDFDKADVVLALRSMKSKAAPSMSGWTKEFFTLLLQDASSSVAEFLPQYMSSYVNLTLPPMVLSFSSNSSGFPLYKKDKSIRPISIPCFLNKLAWKMSMHRVNKSWVDMPDAIQMGLGTKAGCQTAMFIIQSALQQGKIVVKIDSTNAFNTVRRDSFLKPAFADHNYKPIWPLLHLNYQIVTFNVLGDGSIIAVQEGTRQGAVEGTFLFSVALKDIAKEAYCEDTREDVRDDVRYVQIVDDIHAIVEPTVAGIKGLAETIEVMRRCLGRHGLILNNSKTEILCPPDMQLPANVETYRKNREVSECLGALVRLDQSGSIVPVVTSIWEKIQKKLQAFVQMDDLRIDLHLQHLIFQTSFVPSIEYLLITSWACGVHPQVLEIFVKIRAWYLSHFMPLGPTTDVLLTDGSGPLTKALLHLPVRAGGGLGLPCSELVHYRRATLLPSILCPHYFNKYPWIKKDVKYLDTISLPFVPPPLTPRPLHDYNPYDLVCHYLIYQAAFIMYPPSMGVDYFKFRSRWHKATKWRDTSWMKIPPEWKRHRIEDVTFRHTLAAIANYVPGIPVPPSCIGKALPKNDACHTWSDVVDHLLHCASCACSTLVRKHNSVNHAVSRTIVNYSIDYSKEPRGLPVVHLEKENDGHLRPYRHFDGPDGLFNTFDGLTALEIHCSHQRLFYSPGDRDHYDSVTVARSEKMYKYRNFEKNYPGIHLEVFTVSTGGVIHQDTIQQIKERWLPVADQGGSGLLRMLFIEVAFAVAKTLGNVLQLAKVMKHV